MNGDEIKAAFERARHQTGEWHPAWKAFVLQMKNRRYGPGAITTAWEWYREGWDGDNESHGGQLLQTKLIK